MAEDLLVSSPCATALLSFLPLDFVVVELPDWVEGG
jgi:hypothetical protein